MISPSTVPDDALLLAEAVDALLSCKPDIAVASLKKLSPVDPLPKMLVNDFVVPKTTVLVASRACGRPFET